MKHSYENQWSVEKAPGPWPLSEVLQPPREAIGPSLKIACSGGNVDFKAAHDGRWFLNFQLFNESMAVNH